MQDANGDTAVVIPAALQSKIPCCAEIGISRLLVPPADGDGRKHICYVNEVLTQVRLFHEEVMQMCIQLLLP